MSKLKKSKKKDKKQKKSRKIKKKQKKITKNKKKTYKNLNFYKCKSKLYYPYNRLYLWDVNLMQLIQIDDTDSPPKKWLYKDLTLDQIHEWITKLNKGGLGGNVKISKEKLKYILDLCEPSKKEIKEQKKKDMERKKQYLLDLKKNGYIK